VTERDPASSAKLTVTFKLSLNCLNGGIPDNEKLAADGLITPTFLVVPCDCPLGWEGKNS